MAQKSARPESEYVAKAKEILIENVFKPKDPEILALVKQLKQEKIAGNVGAVEGGRQHGLEDLAAVKTFESRRNDHRSGCGDRISGGLLQLARPSSHNPWNDRYFTFVFYRRACSSAKPSFVS
jgi:hypothetical protein